MTKPPKKAAPAKAKPAPKKAAPAKKQSTPKLSTLASKAMRGEKLTKDDIASLGASVLSQDEKKGQS